jgi:hypothetical protein
MWLVLPKLKRRVPGRVDSPAVLASSQGKNSSGRAWHPGVEEGGAGARFSRATCMAVLAVSHLKVPGECYTLS